MAAVASSGPAVPLASNNMPAASSGRVSSADPAGRPSATARGIGKRSRQDGPVPASEPDRQQEACGKRSRQDGSPPASEPDRQQEACGKRSRQDAPPPASEPNGQHVACSKGISSCKRPRGMVHGAAAPAVADAGAGTGAGTGEGTGEGAVPVPGAATGPGAPVIKVEAVDGPDAPYRDLGKAPFDQEELTRCVVYLPRDCCPGMHAIRLTARASDYVASSCLSLPPC